MRVTSADTLRAIIEQRGLSYEQVALRGGCSKSFVGHLVAGRKTSCTPELAEHIAETLEVPVALLFMDTTSAGRGRSIRKKVAS